MKRILVKNPDGSVAITIPAPEFEDDIETIAESLHGGSDYSIVEHDVIPTDRTFRNAWECCAKGEISVNLTKAQAITHEVRRAARTVEMAPLDIEATIPVLMENAEAERQVLRDKYADIQEQIDNVTSVEELKAIYTDLQTMTP